MLIKVRRGPFNPRSGDLQPNGEELWSGGDEELSAAVLNAMNEQLQVGSWYTLEDFAKLLAELQPPQEHEVPSAITVQQLGVSCAWSTAIQIGESRAALMICRSVVEHVRRLRAPGNVWVWVE
jgi:hypothetical protein